MNEIRIKEIEGLISDLMLKILPPLKLDKIIQEDLFENLFKHFEELKDLIKGNVTVNRSLANMLFHFYYSVYKDFSFIPRSDQINNIQSQLTLYIASIFNDNHLL